MQTIFSIIGLLGGLAGIAGAFYAYAQVSLIKQERARRENEERELDAWAARAQDVVQKLVALVPRWSSGGNGLPNAQLYPLILSDTKLRGLVESYLIQMYPSASRADARMLPPEMLRLERVRDTIKRVEDCFIAVRKDNPKIADLAQLP